MNADTSVPLKNNWKNLDTPISFKFFNDAADVLDLGEVDFPPVFLTI